MDVWTRIFQAKTWGDWMEIAAEYNEFQNTVEQINRLSADEKVRLQCEARERVMNHERAMNKKLAKQEDEIAQQKAKLVEKDVKIVEQGAELEKKDNEIARLQAELARLKGES